MDEVFSHQIRRFSAAILTYGKGNRRSYGGKKTGQTVCSGCEYRFQKFRSSLFKGLDSILGIGSG